MFRSVTEIKCLLHAGSQTRDSTIAVGANTPGINNADNYYDLNHTWNYVTPCQLLQFHVFSLLLNFPNLIIF